MNDHRKTKDQQLDPTLPLVWAEAAALTGAVKQVLDNAVNYNIR